MLKVTVEVWPYGDRRARREIAAMAIGNLGTTGRDGVASYVAMLSDDGDGSVPRAAMVSHLREAGVWELIRRVLDGATPDALASLSDHESGISWPTRSSTVHRSMAVQKPTPEPVGSRPVRHPGIGWMSALLTVDGCPSRDRSAAVGADSAGALPAPRVCT